jgi:dephospho-CoA kinase
MLRVGLTGGLGSGKSTVAKMLARHGAYVLSADEIGRTLMTKGQPVFWAVLNHFGPAILMDDGSLDRMALARVAFGEGRAEELNAIVHPAVIARQAEITAEIAAAHPKAVVVVESALLFETKYGGEGGWQTRFDRIVLVRAAETLKISRFIARTLPGTKVDSVLAAEVHAEAQRRLGLQRDDDWKAAHSDYVLTNDGSLEDLQAQVDALWPKLADEAEREGPRPEGGVPVQ